MKINEIVKQLFLWNPPQKEDRDEMTKLYLETLTSFESRIRAEEREKVRKEVWHERNSLVYEAHEGYKKLIPSLLEDARQSIYKELIDAIEAQEVMGDGPLVDHWNEALKRAAHIIKQKQEGK